MLLLALLSLLGYPFLSRVVNVMQKLAAREASLGSEPERHYDHDEGEEVMLVGDDAALYNDNERIGDDTAALDVAPHNDNERLGDYTTASHQSPASIARGEAPGSEAHFDRSAGETGDLAILGQKRESKSAWRIDAKSCRPQKLHAEESHKARPPLINRSCRKSFSCRTPPVKKFGERRECHLHDIAEPLGTSLIMCCILANPHPPSWKRSHFGCLRYQEMNGGHTMSANRERACCTKRALHGDGGRTLQ